MVDDADSARFNDGAADVADRRERGIIIAARLNFIEQCRHHHIDNMLQQRALVERVKDAAYRCDAARDEKLQRAVAALARFFYAIRQQREKRPVIGDCTVFYTLPGGKAYLLPCLRVTRKIGSCGYNPEGFRRLKLCRIANRPHCIGIRGFGNTF